MHLKSIRLTGFKAFADSTQLEFGPGITAIVGPNGSGKSNIVDAMLWALGERSHKAIRTGESTDVIFSGSGSRRALGMAEVSLTMDNSDGALPVDFSEVTVTRRLYRDGESEYELNQTGCRLKDLIELFLDSGVGAGTYSIVGQRDIDAVLSARPEDRRELLEHAAGVQKYRFKRAEAKRKLERTELNLTRVRDIMHELESQLEPLAEQAELAREHAQLVARLRQLTLALLARDYEVRAKRLENLAEQRDTVQDALAQASVRVEALEEEERSLDRQLRAMEDRIADLQREATETLTRVKSTEGQIAVAEERGRSLAEQREFFVQEIGILESRVVGLSHQSDSAQRELAECEAVMVDADAVMAAAEAKFAAATARLAEAAQALDTGKDDYVESMRNLAEARNQGAASQARSESYRRRLEALTAIAETIAEEQRSAENGLERAELALAAQQAELADCEQQLARARGQRDDHRAELGRRETEVNAAQRAVSEVHSRRATLEETQRNLEGFDHGVRAALQQWREGKLTGPLWLVGDVLRVPKKFERALESALGEAVQTLATENETTAQLLFDWLRAHAQGRVSVLPRNLLAPRHPAPAAVGGVRALDVVQCDEAHRDFVEALLGDLYIVADREAALAARGAAPGVTLVTHAGQVYHPSGLLRGGDGQSGPGFISRRREMEELRARGEELEAGIAELEGRIANTRAALTEAEAAIQQFERGRVSALSAIAALEREVDHLRRESSRLRLQQEQVQADTRELAAESEREREEHARLAGRLTRLDTERAQLEIAIASRQHQAAEASRWRDAAAQEMAEIRAQQSAARERLAAVRKFHAELERQRDAATGEIEDKRHAIQRARAEEQELRGQVARDREALVGLRARQAAAEQSFETWRRDRLAVLEQVEQLGASARSERSRRHDAETELHKIELRDTQTRTEMEESARRFGEEFQQTMAEALTHAAEVENKQAALEEQAALREKLAHMGSVNLGAISQQEALRERMEFLQKQRADLEQGQRQLAEIIAEIDGRTREQFLSTFEQIQREFDYMFVRIFDGGATRLTLTDPEHLLETGIDIRVQLPGKAEQDLLALSGGERALTALSLLLSLLRVKPSPFCVLDEVDAPLDQSNVGRFASLLREFGARTQFIVITHNSGTMEAADALYGVTMQEQGVSKLVSMRLVDAARSERVAA